MKTKSTVRNFLLLVGSSLLAISSASAQVYWDTDASNPGFGSASGTWGIDAFWNSLNTGGAGTFTTVTTGAINFGNGATGLGAGTINVNGTQTATGSITFATGSGEIILSGGEITLPATATITTNAPLSTTNTISSAISGGATSITKAGAGTLVLDGTNTTTTTFWGCSGGRLVFCGAAALNGRQMRFTGDNNTIRLQSNSNLNITTGGVQTYGQKNCTFQVDRVDSGSGDGLTFSFANPASNNNSWQVNDGGVLNISAGPNITSGTPTLEVTSPVAFRVSEDAFTNATINASGVNVRINTFASNTRAGKTRTYNLGGTSTGNEVYNNVTDSGSMPHIIVKNGSGTWTFSGSNNSYTGSTTINAGTLAITGATLGTSSITFGVGGTGVLGLSTGVNVAAASATVNLTNGKILVLGTTGAPSYALLTANSITGTPVPASPLPAGYELQVVDGTTDELRLVDISTATPYETWATGGELFEDDANGDGVDNGTAFLLGAAGPNAAVTIPTVTQTPAGLVLNFNMLKPANRGTATLGVEHSRDLGSPADPWTTVLVTDVNSGPTSGVTFAVGSGAGATNPVTATISASEAGGTGKLFGRLKAMNP